MAGINHVNVKASGQKGYAAEWNKDHEQKGNHDCKKFQHLNHVIENRTDFPAGPVEGQIIYRTDENKLYIWDGAAWVNYAIDDDIAIKTGTHYWSCNGCNFVANYGHNEFVEYELLTGKLQAKTLFGTAVLAPVFLPHGAVVTGVIVYGSDATESWVLTKIKNDATVGVQMANANINTEDNTINVPIIDNSGFSYFFFTSVLGQHDEIYGARITYTL